MKTFFYSVSRMLSALPIRGALAVGRGMGNLFGWITYARQREAVKALQLAFPARTPKECRQMVRRMYRHLGMNLAEIMRVLGGKMEELDDRVTVEGRPYFDEAMARGRGVIILTAHIGNWDLLAMLAIRLGQTLTIISKNMRHSSLDDVWMDLRGKMGVNILPAHHAIRPALAALKRKEILGFILDQNRPKETGIFVDFFGRPACTSTGLAYIASQTQSPIVPVFIHRTKDHRHVIEVGPLLEPPENREPETIERETQRYTRIIEDAVRTYPEQWIWMHRRWKTVPPGTAEQR